MLLSDRSAVFELEDKACAALEVKECLLCGPEDEGEAVLIRQKGTREGVRYRGIDNRYHNLKDFWVASETEPLIGLTDFAEQLKKLKLGQDSSLVLKGIPWKDKEFIQKLEEQHFQEAVKIDCQLAELRLTGNTNHAVGVEAILGGKPVELPALVRKNELIVKDVGVASNGVYPSLGEAILASKKPGDVILIQKNGEVPVEPQRLEKAMMDLTIKPDKGFRPILVLGETAERDTAMFRLHDGKLHLEGLEIRLRPEQRGFTAQTLVAFLGDGQCTLKDCVITLEAQGNDTTLSVCSLRDQDGVMKMPAAPERPAGQGPQLAIENCFIRGDGDLLVSKTDRPFSVKLRNLLATLKGTLLVLKPGSRQGMNGTGQVSAWLDNVTTYLGGYLIDWELDKEARGVLTPQCTANNCAFFPASMGNALIRLEIPEMEMDQVRAKLKMIGLNACGYSFLFADLHGKLDMSLKLWADFTDNLQSRSKVKLATPPAAEPAFSKLLPGQFKLLDSDGFGADLGLLGKLLPAEKEED